MIRRVSQVHNIFETYINIKYSFTFKKSVYSKCKLTRGQNCTKNNQQFMNFKQLKKKKNSLCLNKIKIKNFQSLIHYNTTHVVI